MPNQFSAFFVDALSLMARRLGQKLVWYRLIPSDVSGDIAEMSETVKVPIPPVVGTVDVPNTGIVPSGADLEPTSVNVELTEHRAAAFQVTDRERRAVAGGTLTRILESAVDSLAGYIDSHIGSTVYKPVYGVTGTQGTALFSATAGLTQLIKGNRALDDRLKHEAQRSFVINSAAKEGLLSVANLVQANQRGSGETLRTGQIGEVMGVDVNWSPNAPRHSDGSGSKAVDGAATAGSTSVHVDGSGSLKYGDIITFAGGTETYAVQAAVGAGDQDLQILPPLTRALADNVAISRIDSHDVNLLFEGPFAAMAFGRLEGVVTPGAGRVVAALIDPESGVPLRYVIEGAGAREKHFIDALWGSMCVRPELAQRLIA